MVNTIQPNYNHPTKFEPLEANDLALAASSLPQELPSKSTPLPQRKAAARPLLEAALALGSKNPLDRFRGRYVVTYYKAWFIPIYIDVEIQSGDGVLHAKIRGENYDLLPIPGRDKEFTAKGKPGSVIRFSLKGDKVKKVFIHLPEYGDMEGKPK